MAEFKKGISCETWDPVFEDDYVNTKFNFFFTLGFH